MNDLKKLVKELFEQESLVRSLDKEIKNTRAHYHHLILKNSERIYSDDELMTIYSIHEKLVELEKRQAGFNDRTVEIKAFLRSLVQPLNGGRWIHETDDFVHPKLEFWIEDDELMYARLNGRSYD